MMNNSRTILGAFCAGLLVLLSDASALAEGTPNSSKHCERSIVVLSVPALGAVLSEIEGIVEDNQLPNPQLVGAHLLKIEKEQAAARIAIENSGANVLGNTSRVLNSLLTTALTDSAQSNLENAGYRVFCDGIVKADLAESVPLVRAPEAWTLGPRGAGARIGIIDSGIDYTVPDLGGCALTNNINDRSCPKVPGGYNFVDNNQNVMDRNSHGTHVASIAAGNGTLRGVAPDASLYALRVLNELGAGYDFNVIRALEWSVDPNGDGNIIDRMDVVNMSLGFEGADLDHPVSQAVDNAVGLYVSVVASAGNSGRYGDEHIRAPGAARRAITVGAISKQRLLAPYSSRGAAYSSRNIHGESSTSFLLKPDISAPGTGICASISLHQAFSQIQSDCLTNINASHAVLSGTSMATPHVTGAVAILRRRFPGFSPDQIKAVLLRSAAPLAEPRLYREQGRGMLDVRSALNVFSPLDHQLTKVDVAGKTLRIFGIPPTAAASNMTLEVARDRPLSQIAENEWRLLASISPGLPRETLFLEEDLRRYTDADWLVRFGATNTRGERYYSYGILPVRKFEFIAARPFDSVNPRKDLLVEIRPTTQLGTLSAAFQVSRDNGPWTSTGIVPVSSNPMAAILKPIGFGSASSIRVRATVTTPLQTEEKILTDIAVEKSLSDEFPRRYQYPVRTNLQGQQDVYFSDLQPVVAQFKGESEPSIVVVQNDIAATLEILRLNGTVRASVTLPALTEIGNPSDMVRIDPAVITDLNNDGQSEIYLSRVHFSSTANRFVWELFGYDTDARPLPGFPRSLPTPLSEGFAQILAVDLDLDGQAELLAFSAGGTAGGQLIKVSYAGEAIVLASSISIVGPSRINVTKVRSLFRPLIGNITGGPEPEIVLADFESPTYFRSRVLAFGHHGNQLPGEWPVMSGTFGGSGVLVDLVGDSALEIAVPLNRLDESAGVLILNDRGQVLQTIELAAGVDAQLQIVGGLSAADITGDGQAELFVSGRIIERTPRDGGGIVGSRLFAFTRGGQALAGWPIDLGQPVSSEMLAGRISGSGVVAVAAGDSSESLLTSDRGLYAFDQHGQILSGFPRRTEANDYRWQNYPPALTRAVDGTLHLISASGTDRDFTNALREIYLFGAKRRGSLYNFQLKSGVIEPGGWFHFRGSAKLHGCVGRVPAQCAP